MNIIVIFLALFLVSCSSNKEILSGKREKVVVKTETKKYNEVKITLPSPVLNHSWMKRGGDLGNNMQPFLLSEKLSKKWSADISTHGESDIVIHNNGIYTKDAKGMISAFDAETRKLKWQFDSTPKDRKGDSLKGGLLLLEKTLIVNTAFGEVYALSLCNGKPLWKQKLTAPLRSSSVFYKGALFLTTISNETFSLDAKTGAIIWKHQGVTEITSFLGLVTPAVSDDVVVTAYTSGEYFALDYKTGDVLWGDTLTPTYRSDTMGNIAHINSLPVINNGHVYIMSYGGRAVCSNLKTGQKVWEKNIGSGHDFTIAGDTLFFIDYNNTGVYGIDKNSGVEKWRFDFEKLNLKSKDMNFYSPFLINNKVFLSTKSGKLIFIDLGLKDSFKIIDTTVSFTSAPIVVYNLLYAINDNGYLVCYG